MLWQWSAGFPTLNRISVTVSRWRRRGDRRGSRGAAPKWVFHLYASEWLRGVLLGDKDLPPRPLQTHRGPGAACSSSAITAAPLRYNTIRPDRGHWHPEQPFHARDLLRTNRAKSKWLLQPCRSLPASTSHEKGACGVTPCRVVNGRGGKKIKQINRRCEAVLFPEDFLMMPSVQRERPRLLAAAPHADRSLLTINRKYQRYMTPCVLRSAFRSRICQSYVLLWFSNRKTSEESENCSDASRKWTLPAPSGWKGSPCSRLSFWAEVKIFL